MALVGTTHGQRNFSYRQVGGLEKLLGACQAPLDYVLMWRKPARLLEDMREMIWVQLERCGHLDGKSLVTTQAMVEKLHAAANASSYWYERLPEEITLEPWKLAYDYMTRSGRMTDERLRELSPKFITRVEAERNKAE